MFEPQLDSSVDAADLSICLPTRQNLLDHLDGSPRQTTSIDYLIVTVKPPPSYPVDGVVRIGEKQLRGDSIVSQTSALSKLVDPPCMVRKILIHPFISLTRERLNVVYPVRLHRVEIDRQGGVHPWME